ncbi:MAG: RNA methyltransferase [Planctomycetota bacterium]
MREPTVITSLQNARVKALVKLRGQRGRREAGLFIAEGRRAVERAMMAGIRFVSVWLCGALLGDKMQEIESDLTVLPDLGNPFETVRVPASVFKKIAYVREPEGVLAVCEARAWSSVDQLRRPNNPDHPGFVDTGGGSIDLVAVGTEKPGNLGAMVRTADLAGCRSVVAAGTPVDIYNPNAIRASTGAVFVVPTLSMSEEDAIAMLKEKNIRILAAVVDGQVEHTEADYSGSIAIVIGPEDRGLSDLWKRAAADTDGQTVRIATQAGSADSLNASVAAGVMLFEARRQRREAGLQ